MMTVCCFQITDCAMFLMMMRRVKISRRANVYGVDRVGGGHGLSISLCVCFALGGSLALRWRGAVVHSPSIVDDDDVALTRKRSVKIIIVSTHRCVLRNMNFVNNNYQLSDCSPMRRTLPSYKILETSVVVHAIYMDYVWECDD